MSKNQTSFTSETGKKASEKRSKASIAKSGATKTVQNVVKDKLVQGELQDYIRSALLAPNSSGKIYYQQFVNTFLSTAKKDPNSRCGQLLASSMFSEHLMEKLDAETEKMLARDLAFSRYRLHTLLFKEQKQVVEDLASKSIAVIDSRRAGKTNMNGKLLVDRCLTPNTPALYVNLTFANAVNQIWDEVIKSADSISLARTSESKADGYIEFTNGSSILIKGNSNITDREKLRGYKFRCVIIDEVQSQQGLKYLIDDILSPTMGDFADSQIFLTGTPPRAPDTYIENIWTTEGNGWTKYSWTAAQNPFIPNWEATLDSICKSKGLTREDPFIQREYLGKFAYDVEAQVFKNYLTYEEIPDSFIPTNVAIGCDWGFNDQNAVVPLVYNVGTGEGYVMFDKKFNKSTVTTIVSEIKDSMEKVKEFCISRNPDFELANIGIFCDTNEKSIVYELSVTYGLPAYCAFKHDKQLATSTLQDLLRTRIKVHVDSPLVNEFKKTLYKRNENDEITSEIDDAFYHADSLDALTYASRQYCYDCNYDDTGKDRVGAFAN